MAQTLQIQRVRKQISPDWTPGCYAVPCIKVSCQRASRVDVHPGFHSAHWMPWSSLHLLRGRGHPLASHVLMDSLCSWMAFSNSHRTLFRLVEVLLDIILLWIKYTISMNAKIFTQSLANHSKAVQSLLGGGEGRRKETRCYSSFISSPYWLPGGNPHYLALGGCVPRGSP